MELHSVTLLFYSTDLLMNIPAEWSSYASQYNHMNVSYFIHSRLLCTKNLNQGSQKV